MASTSIQPWDWIIETLADLKQVDTSLLSALISRNFSAVASESVRERVSLRFLEDLADSCPSNAQLTPGSKCGIDVSRSSEEVLCSYMKKVKTPCTLDNGGSELSSHDLHQFILQKRAALPKSSLALLKESILQGHPLITSSLRESSGLSMPTSAVEHAEQLKSSDNGPVALGPNSGDLVSEGEEQNVAEADQANNIHSKIATTDNDAQLLEQDATCQMPANLKATVNDSENKSFCQITSVLGNSTSSLPNHLSPAKNVSDLDRRILDVEQNVAEADQANNIHSRIATTDNDSRLLEQDVTCQMPTNLKGTVNDSENKSLDQTSVLGNSTSSLPNHLSPVKKVSDLYGRILDAELSVVPETPNEDGDSENVQSDFDPNEERLNVEKHLLLSSQISVDHDTNSGGWTEQSLCIKCEKDGQLLSCNASDCTVSVHESCLGPLGCLDKTGLFYCPFCYYNMAAKAYAKARKKLSRARKALSSFIGKSSVVQMKLLSATAPRETSQAGVSENEDNQPNLQSSQNQRGKSVDCSLKEKENDQHRGVADDHTKAYLSNGHAVDPVCDVSNSAAVNHVEVTDDHQGVAEVQHNEPGDLAHPMDNAPCGGQKLAEPLGTTDNCNSDREEMDAFEIRCSDSYLCEEDEIGLVNGQGEVPMSMKHRKKVKNTHVYDTKGEGPSSQQSNRRSKRKRWDTSVGSFDHNQEKKVTSKRVKSSPGDSRKPAVRAKRMPNLMSTLCRRNKLFWSPEEEKALKGAVKKIGARSDGTLPWRQILELGGNKFHNTRKPSDLKDKWRNIMKKELKHET